MYDSYERTLPELPLELVPQLAAWVRTVCVVYKSTNESASNSTMLINRVLGAPRDAQMHFPAY